MHAPQVTTTAVRQMPRLKSRDMGERSQGGDQRNARPQRFHTTRHSRHLVLSSPGLRQPHILRCNATPLITLANCTAHTTMPCHTTPRHTPAPQARQIGAKDCCMSRSVVSGARHVCWHLGHFSWLSASAQRSRYITPRPPPPPSAPPSTHLALTCDSCCCIQSVGPWQACLGRQRVLWKAAMASPVRECCERGEGRKW